MSRKRRPGRGSLARTWRAVTEFAARRERNLFFVVFVPIAIIYVATMRWALPVNIDAFTNTLTAHYIATTGAPFAVDHETLISGDPGHQFSWMYMTDDGPLSPYPPGAPYLAAPFYALAGSELSPLSLTSTAYENSRLESSVPPVWPGSLMSALASAVAVGFMALAFGRIGTPGEAIVGAYVAGLGTSVWSVAADQLWQHGPSIMFLAIAAYLLLAEREWWAGVAFAGVVLSRPQGAVIAAVTGLALVAFRRSVWPAIRIGIPSLGGAGLLLWYHRSTSGRWTVLGGEGAEVTERLSGAAGDAGVGSGWVADLIDYLWNIVQGVVGFEQGFLIWSPFLLVLVLGIRRGWAQGNDVVRALGIGAVAFWLVQYRIQIFGHATYFGYRYPLEGLVASAPVFFATAVAWRASRPVVLGLSALAVALFAAGAITG